MPIGDKRKPRTISFTTGQDRYINAFIAAGVPASTLIQKALEEFAAKYGLPKRRINNDELPKGL